MSVQAISSLSAQGDQELDLQKKAETSSQEGGEDQEVGIYELASKTLENSSPVLQGPDDLVGEPLIEISPRLILGPPILRVGPLPCILL